MSIISRVKIIGEDEEGYIFKPEIKNPSCLHEWKTLRSKVNIHGLFSGGEVEFEYLFCPKCSSTNGEPIT